MSLSGTVLYTNPAPLSTIWYLYSGPTNVIFANAAQTNTTVTFTAPGTYTLMLSASNGVHTTAYDAVVITVVNAIRLNIQRNGTNATLRWTGGSPPFTVESVSAITSSNWVNVSTLAVNQMDIAVTNFAGVYRVRGQ